MHADVDGHHPHEQERYAQEEGQPPVVVGDLVDIDGETGIAHLTHRDWRSGLTAGRAILPGALTIGEGTRSAMAHRGHYDLFDAYGTLFDVHSATAALASEIGPPRRSACRTSGAPRSSNTAGSTPSAGKPSTFRKLLKSGLNYALSATGTNPALADRLMAAYDELEPLSRRQGGPGGAAPQKHSRIAILSNGEPDMLDKAVRAAGIDGLIDHVLSAQRGRHFQALQPRLPPGHDQIRRQTRRYHLRLLQPLGCCGHFAFGFTLASLNRSHAPDEYLDMPAAVTIPDLHGLPLLKAS